MNILLRHAPRFSIRRTIPGTRRLPARLASGQASNHFVPPASLHDVLPEEDEDGIHLPKSPSFYTGRANYYDQLHALEDAVHLARTHLRALNLYPLPAFARAHIPRRAAGAAWVSRGRLSELVAKRDSANDDEESGDTQGVPELSVTRYRKITTLLNELDEMRRIAATAGEEELQEALNGVTSMFEGVTEQEAHRRNVRRPVKFDEYGRSYTVGRRKTSSARVWMIRVQEPITSSRDNASGSDSSPSASTNTAADAPDKSFEEDLALIKLFTQPSAPPTQNVSVTPSQILINARALASYFALPSDRARVVRPLQLAGALGSFHVFALVRGGGPTGQAGAVSLGIAKALAAFHPEVADILKKAKLLRRDPRMVERKKPGKAKARKRYAWVKR